MRETLDMLKRIPAFALCIKGLKHLVKNGPRSTCQKIREKMRPTLTVRSPFTPAELKAQRSEHFQREIKFSIVTPLYNTPERFLREMIQSVQNQTYANWELCLADGSDAGHGEVEKACRGYADKDTRIKYQKLEKNLGISGNSNASLEMATGEFIALLDHDDLLHPAALHEVMRAICEQGADFVYTDEATFKSPNVKRILSTHFKPDFAPDNLRSNNYICHFTAFRAGLLETTGLFRSEYDGSQDHDLFLRLTEQAEKIVHIPKLLYYWRAHPNSVAQNIAIKDYAAPAGRNAVKNYLEAHGIIAEVDSSDICPTIYRLRYPLTAKPKVSIILTGGTAEQRNRCIRSITNQTAYSRYEIVAVSNEVSAGCDSKGNGSVIQYRETDIKNGNAFARDKNVGALRSGGEYLLFLNADAQVLTPNWIEEMMMFAQRKDVGAVGAMIFNAKRTVQSAGILLGLGRDHIAANAFQGQPEDAPGYMGRLIYAQNLSAVSSGCMLVKKSVFEAIGRFDEAYTSIYCDADFCLRLRRTGRLIVWTPFAKVRLSAANPAGAQDISCNEATRFRARWEKELHAGDSYYNPNLTLDREDFSLRLRRTK